MKNRRKKEKLESLCKIQDHNYEKQFSLIKDSQNQREKLIDKRIEEQQQKDEERDF